MEAFRIRGGRRLEGTLQVAGSKNAALPIMAASLLADGPVELSRVPMVTDVATLAQLLAELGLTVRRPAGDRLELCPADDCRAVVARRSLVSRMRATFCVLGPLVARRGRAIVALPGGCRIGDRPVDLHLKGLETLGADLRIDRGHVIARARRLRGARINMSGERGPTVTGTANVMSAATLARGTTVLEGAATEPEVVDLGQFLIALGARIEGLGTSTITIQGVDSLGGATHRITSDRIEAGTLLMAVAATGGAVRLCDVETSSLANVCQLLTQAGLDLEATADGIALQSTGTLRALDYTALPYPGLPTDLQAQWTALMSQAAGSSRVRDLVFPERFAHVAELRGLGAQIGSDGSSAIVFGRTSLVGAKVRASDLRASAALIIAGLATKGETIVRRIHHLDRGYEQLDLKLRQLGADVERRVAAPRRAVALRSAATPR